MVSLLLSLVLTFVQNPIWPLGENPIPGDPFVIVNKSKNELAFVYENQVQTIVPVATGKTNELTPEGLFTVTVKAPNPYYRRGDIAGGDPKNPLGTRWIGFNANDTDGRIYGLHGTNQPHSIGTYASNGCVRLQNGDIEALFTYIPLGTKILVTSTSETYESLAIKYGAIKQSRN